MTIEEMRGLDALKTYKELEEQKQRIKRLENAGDKMSDLLDGGVFMKLAVQWNEAKESK